MSKYFVSVPVDFITGHLRYGHFEGEITIPDDKINDSNYLIDTIRDNCNLIVDDWEIDGYGDIDLSELELRRLENDK